MMSRRNKYSGNKAFLGMAITCVLCCIPVILTEHLVDRSCGRYGPYTIEIIESLRSTFEVGTNEAAILLLISAIAHHAEYCLNFELVGDLATEIFGASDLQRRSTISLLGMLFFKNLLSNHNIIGVSVTISGVLWYSFVEHQKRKHSK